MTGRRLFSIFGTLLGVITFFLPLIVVSMPPLGNEIRWSGYSVVSGLVGFTSDNFYDVAATVIYGDDEPVPDSSNQLRKESRDSQRSGGLAALASIVSAGISYCALLCVAAMALIKYSPRITLRISAVGLVASCLALVSTFVFADQLQSNRVGAFSAERGLVRADVGYGLYLLVAAFALLLVVQKFIALDRLFSSSE